MKYLYYYLIFINIISFFAFLVDKNKARKGRWRIPERTLFLLALLLGSPGCIVGMYIFRHKTKHMKFYLGMPAILIIQFIIFYLIYNRY